MTILEMIHSLRTVLMAKIESGSMSVGLIARRSSLTKSHVSNFLHAKGSLSLAAMHRIMESQHVHAEDLIQLSPNLPSIAEGIQFVPIAASRWALLQPVIGAADIEGWLPLSVETLQAFTRLRVRTRQSWWRFVAVRLDRQEARTTGGLAFDGSVIVIDRHYSSIRDRDPKRRNLYAVFYGKRLIVGYADAMGNQLVIQPRATAMRAVFIDPRLAGDGPAGVGPAEDAGRYIAGRVAMITNVF